MDIPQIPKDTSTQTTRTTFGSEPETAPMVLLKQLDIAMHDGDQSAIQDRAMALILWILHKASECKDPGLMGTIYNKCNELHIKCAQAADNSTFINLITATATFLLKHALRESNLELGDQYLQALLNIGSHPRYTSTICNVLKELQAAFGEEKNDSAFGFLFEPIENLEQPGAAAAAMRSEVAPSPALLHKTPKYNAASLTQKMCTTLDIAIKIGDYENVCKLLNPLTEMYSLCVQQKKDFDSAAYIFDRLTAGYLTIYASNVPNAQSAAKNFFICIKQLHEGIPKTRDYKDLEQNAQKNFAIITTIHSASHPELQQIPGQTNVNLDNPFVHTLNDPAPVAFPTLQTIQQWLTDALTYVNEKQYKQASDMYRKVSETRERLQSSTVPEIKALVDEIEEQLGLHRGIHASFDDQFAIEAMGQL